MLCPKCGALIADDSAFCSKCGATIQNPQPAQTQPAQAQQAPELPAVPAAQTPPDQTQQIPSPPPVYPQMSTCLTQNILLTVFSVACCLFYALPTAVTGLVFSCIAQSALKQNDIPRALQNIKLARIFMWISFGIEIAVVVWVVVALLLGMTSVFSGLGNMFKNGFDNFKFDFNLDGLDQLTWIR